MMVDFKKSGLFWCVAVVGVLVLLPSMRGHADSESETQSRPWSVFAYAGMWNDTRFEDIPQVDLRLNNSFLGTLGLSRNIYEFNEHLLLEGEVNVTRHWGKQHHFEVNSAVSLRWRRFPWDRYVDTTFSCGLGFSYAFRRPPLEQRTHQDPTNLLLFLPIELTFAPPRRYDIPWETFFRVHHRSGAFGLVSNARGSDFIATGIRYRF